LESIAEASRGTSGNISKDAWTQIVNIAWDNQNHPGDRRAIQAQMTEILEQMARKLQEGEDATS
jgi:hypothetical protein